MTNHELPAGDARRRIGLPWGVRPPAWVLLLASIPFLTAMYLSLPTTGLERTVAYPAFGLIGMIAILLGMRTRPSPRAASWRLIALALALLAIGDITYSVLLAIDGEVPYPSLADVGYVLGYVTLIAGTAGLVRRRLPGGDRTPFIDAAILSAGVGSLAWVVLIQPSLVGAVDPIVAIVSMLYPGFDLILLALGLRVLLMATARPRYLQLLVAGITIYFIADVIYAMDILNGTYVDNNPVDAGWIIGILVIGVAGLHPSVADAVRIVDTDETRLSRPRFALLALAALIAPTILLIRELEAGDDVVVGLIAEWAILFGLVLVRLASTVDELAVSLRLRRRLQGDLAFQAHHDPLTRLANRLLFEERLAAAMATAPQTTALIFLDLDDFKTINDTLGHASGDELLRILAGRVERCLRGTDLAARLGGDEFAILVEDCGDLSLARVVAERALTALRAPAALGERQLLVHASAGVAIGHQDSTATDLMRDADVAMYQAKSHGKDRVEAFESAMHNQVIRGYELRTELAEAIKAKAFVLHYQPVVNLEGGTIVGAEALVRWNHPERGLLGPHDFIPQAESSGLIHPLGRWILHEACATAAGWPARPDGQFPAISVNLAASQLLQPGLYEEIAATLAETGLTASRLILEVTESALVDLDLARVALVRLHELDVQLALDDFGTGYSALSYLAELPFDIVKIDRSFVATIGQGRRVDALLEGILGLCDALELVTVAEGIEEPHQLDHLRSLGCRIGQGYLFSRPIPAAEFRALLATPRLPRRAAGPGTPPAPVLHRPLPVALGRSPSLSPIRPGGSRRGV